ncbi:CYTH domain-containing protein [Saliterribacillus persicus]|uniref:Uncharacterized protein YjbK n=1 Tax=Saliterribacillus persicus TaxID=930114 RepID=A0A368XRS7_9BACI|nr:CYTH domain-containing protein [Saliterribacillus persicus]RCW69748.1 uncharacterized protein YjbK [Saliterribacillus persicus]
MSQEIEIEFKNLLSLDEYNKIYDYFNLKNEIILTQTNHYFETANFSLKNKGAALRIREKNGKWNLTLKEPNPNGDGLLETHAALEPNEAESYIHGGIIQQEEIINRLNDLSISVQNLQYGGALKTKRIEFPYKDTLIVLDHSVYNGKEDYELEVETHIFEYGKEIFEGILRNLSINKRNTPNKIQRYYETLT